MEIQEVVTEVQWKKFFQVPFYIYGNDPNWIPQMEGDIRRVFDKEANKAYAEGQAKCWILLNDSGKGIGRITAFIDSKRNEKRSKTDGGIGFFECVNNDEAANLLFEVAEQYLIDAGMNVINAPINFGERDKFWGLLVKGWYPPLYHENYHPSYYRRFLENRSYLPNDQTFTFGGKMDGLAFDRVDQLARRVRERYGVQSRTLRIGDLKNESDTIAEVYNATFSNVPHFKALTGGQIYGMLKQMKPVMDPYLCCITYAGDKAIGFCALMPDINKALQFTKGKLQWWKMPRFLYNLKFGKGKIIKGVAFGIHPDFQRRGVFSEMVDFLITVKNKHNLRTYESLGLATIRGGNIPMVKSTTAALNVDVERVHLSFAKIVNDGVYEPYPSSDIDHVPIGNVPDESIYPTH